MRTTQIQSTEFGILAVSCRENRILTNSVDRPSPTSSSGDALAERGFRKLFDFCLLHVRWGESDPQYSSSRPGLRHCVCLHDIQLNAYSLRDEIGWVVNPWPSLTGHTSPFLSGGKGVQGQNYGVRSILQMKDGHSKYLTSARIAHGALHAAIGSSYVLSGRACTETSYVVLPPSLRCATKVLTPSCFSQREGSI